MKKKPTKIQVLRCYFALCTTLVLACAWAVITGYGMGFLFFISAAWSVAEMDNVGLI